MRKRSGFVVSAMAFIMAVAMLSGFSSSLYAQEAEDGFEKLLFLDIPIVVTSTLQEQPATQAPSAMNVVTAQQIKERGYRTLKDVMNDIPGWADVSDSNEDIIAVRGIFASTTNKVLIMINGHRMNDLNLGRYNTDQFLGMDVVERIEFIKGPGSVLYGTGALIGVVNVITKQGVDIDGFTVKHKFSVMSGGDIGNESSLTWGKQVNDIDVLANFTFLETEGDEIDQPASLDNPPVGQTARDGVFYWGKYPRNWSFFGSVDYQKIKVDVRKEHYARATPRCPNSAFYSWDSEIIDPLYEEDIFYIDAKYKHEFSDGSTITINPALTMYQLEELSWITSYGADRLPTYGSRGGQDTEYNQWQLKAQYDRELRDNLDMIAGVDTIFADFYNMNSVTGTDGSAFTRGAAETGSWVLVGGFVQLVWAPIEKLELTASTRIDTFEDFADPELVSRIGAVYNITDELTTKLLFGQSLLSPQWAHMKGVTSGTFAANPTMEPETFEGWDFILEYNKEKLSTSISMFRDSVEGLIGGSSSGYAYENKDEITYMGFELEAKYGLLDNLSIEGSYSFVRDEGNTSPDYLVDDDIKNIPQSIYRLGFRYSPLDNMDILLWGRGYSDVRTSDNVTGDTTINSWITADMSVNYKVNDSWDTQLAVTNILDEEYTVGGTVNRPMPRAGRAVHMTVSKKF